MERLTGRFCRAAQCLYNSMLLGRDKPNSENETYSHRREWMECSFSKVLQTYVSTYSY